MNSEHIEATVLVVEDHEIMMEAVSDVLERMGAMVIQARNGRDGIAAAMHNRPDLVISNCSMPEADGLDVLKALRSDARTARLPFVLISGSLHAAARERFEKAGADAILEKGTDVDLFVRTVCEVLNKARENRDAPGRSQLDSPMPT